jgi:hypothetical protein
MAKELSEMVVTDLTIFSLCRTNDADMSDLRIHLYHCVGNDTLGISLCGIDLTIAAQLSHQNPFGS